MAILSILNNVNQIGITDQNKNLQFGGDWTEAKLKVLEGYLQAYTTALKDKPTAGKPFKKGYIDAFAGTGYREERFVNSETSDVSQTLLFPEIAESEAQKLLDGSARIALKTKPRFDKYIFIESSATRCNQLEELKREFPDLADDISVRHGNANNEIQDICNRNWKSHRAVLLLDPFGMQVEWKTIEAIAQTKAIDLWMLFPLGMAVNRLLKRSGEISESWRLRLDSIFGTNDWYDKFYKVETQRTLFGEKKVVAPSVSI
ncbi:MAG: three-Cys-motif partner protein TcmP [bacterium]